MKKKRVRKFKTVFDIESPLAESKQWSRANQDGRIEKEMLNRYKDIVERVAYDPNAALNISFEEGKKSEELERYAKERIPKERLFFGGLKKKNMTKDTIYFTMGEWYEACGVYAVRRALKAGIKPGNIKPMMDVSAGMLLSKKEEKTIGGLMLKKQKTVSASMLKNMKPKQRKNFENYMVKDFEEYLRDKEGIIPSKDAKMIKPEMLRKIKHQTSLDNIKEVDKLRKFCTLPRDPRHKTKKLKKKRRK